MILVRPKANFTSVGSGIRLDSGRLYVGEPATNQPDHERYGLMFVGGMLLDERDYEVIDIPALRHNLVTSTDVAAIANVNVSAVSNWKVRYADFPEPILHNLYLRGQVEEWLISHKEWLIRPMEGEK
jgi:hypothetical protein